MTTISHWTDYPGSGMDYFAGVLCAAERKLGLSSTLRRVRELTADSLADAMKDDIHVMHTHRPAGIPDTKKIVYMAITPPESFFHSAITASATNMYGHGDPWMVYMHALRTADTIVTFNERYRAIIASMSDKHTPVLCTPTGIDLTFWTRQPDPGHFSGAPAVLSAETAMSRENHQFKSPYDLLTAWPLTVPHIKGAPCLHLVGLRPDLHRWFFPLVNANDASYTSHIHSGKFDHNRLRSAFSAIDFYIGLVHKGDTNMTSMQANACGVKTISYRGNPYSDFWITEGDQTIIAQELAAILNGLVPPRDKTPPPSIDETAAYMKAHVYSN